MESNPSHKLSQEQMEQIKGLLEDIRAILVNRINQMPLIDLDDTLIDAEENIHKVIALLEASS